MNVYLDLENPGGSGFWAKGAHGHWENKGATGSRGGRILTQQGGFQVSRQGEQGEQGEQGADHVHMLNMSRVCMQRMKDTSYVHTIIIIGMNVVDNLNSV